MPPRPAEGMPQQEVLRRLRYAIDTATKYPTRPNVEAALRFAGDHPRSMRAGHVRANLGARRWKWLEDHGYYPVGESVEIAGIAAVKGTITPEVTK